MNRDIFDSQVSVYLVKNNFSVWAHHVRPIGVFLNAASLYADIITHNRAVFSAAVDEYAAHGRTPRYDALMKQYKQGKSVPPIAMPQGINPDHNNDGFTQYSDIMCLDFDTKKPHEDDNGNEWVTDWNQVKNELRDNPFISYAALSAGGRGLFVLIPIASHEQHIGHFIALRRLFRECYNLHVDEAAKNIGRLRYMGLDDTPIVNHHAQVFELIDKPKAAAPRATAHLGTWAAHDDTEQRIIECVQQIERQHIDITASHDEWKKASAAIAHHMGERGRAVFHAIARQYHGYSERENDKLFSNLLKGHAASGADCDISTFFWLCRNNGVTVPGHRHIGRRPLPVPVIVKPPQSPQERAQQVERHNSPGAHHEAQESPENAPQDIARLRASSPIIDQLCEALDLEPSPVWDISPEQWKAMHGDMCPF